MSVPDDSASSAQKARLAAKVEELKEEKVKVEQLTRRNAVLEKEVPCSFQAAASPHPGVLRSKKWRSSVVKFIFWQTKFTI